ncbi:hypothetical protein ACFYT4_34275 [Streptomyces sp. NPDC004609]|uniref:hypothetical protein n=1 Tax=Streptomyces sp. NPDC004609 TaxID=3364704 RepID=UPI003676FF2E
MAALTDGSEAASGIAHVWLDGGREATLGMSVPQIGTPAAWTADDGRGIRHGAGEQL